MKIDVDSLVEDNLQLVHFILEKHNYVAMLRPNGFFDSEDLFQEGCEGLYNAAKLFDPKRGIKFSTFAYPHIRGKLSNFFRAQNYQNRKANSLASSLDRPLKEDSETTFLEIIPDEYDLGEEVEVSSLYRKLKKVDERGLVPLLYEGYTRVEIGRMYGVSPASITNWVADLRRKAKGLVAQDQ